MFLRKGQRNITSTRSWTGHLRQSQVRLQLVVAFTWAPQMLPQMLFRELCLVLLQLAPERGRLPAASDKHSPWGEALKHHAVAEIRERYI